MKPLLRVIASFCSMLLACTVAQAQDAQARNDQAHEEQAQTIALPAETGPGQRELTQLEKLAGDAGRGRLVFGPCRTCHYPEQSMGHNNGPNLHRIFGKVAGKQAGFAYYSDDFKAAQFVWTPQLMFVWLENPMAMFPGSTMMSLGVPDAQQRADLIEYLKQASVREP